MDAVKHTTRQTVMAVGDGGNDVSMIQCSSVGVGIVGKEGMQASRAADFSITQYHYLRRLLTVHGINNFSRSWTITFYSLYKSVVLCACQCMFVTFHMNYTLVIVSILSLVEHPNLIHII